MSSTSTAGGGAQLCQMAYAVHGSMDAAEYKHVVLGLSYLKYISGAFEERHARFVAERAQGTDAAGLDETPSGSRPRRTPRTCSAARTSTSCRSSRTQRAGRAASAGGSACCDLRNERAHQREDLL